MIKDINDYWVWYREQEDKGQATLDRWILLDTQKREPEVQKPSPDPPSRSLRKKKGIPRTFDGHQPTERLLKQYGLRVSDFDRMYAEQGGGCGICGNDGERLVIDHDHDTGEVRGLLCSLCNSILGFAQDQEAILHLAIGYLRRAKRKHQQAKFQD